MASSVHCHSLSDCHLSAVRLLEVDLIEVLQHEINEVTTKAWSAGIIGKQVRDYCSSQTPSGTTDRAKAEKLVAAIRARVPTDPKTFASFVNILKGSLSLVPLADRLEEKICASCKMAQLGRGVIDSSTPRSRFPHAMNYQPTSHVREHSPSGLPMATKPQRRKPKKPHSSSTASRTSTHTGHSTSSRIPKLETRDETDEESGFLEEDSATASMTIGSDSNDDSQDDLEDNQSSSVVTATGTGGAILFSTPIHASDAAAEYKAFADNTVGDNEVQTDPLTQDSSTGPIYRESEGIQEIEHGTVSQQQVISGVQPSSGWADMAHHCINIGAEQQSQLMYEIEILQTEISKLQDLMNKREEEKQQIERQRTELNVCKQKLANNERELKMLTKQRNADIRKAEEKLKKEKEDHEVKIAVAENEVELLKQKLGKKTHEAEQLRQQSQQLQEEYDELKRTSEITIQGLRKQLNEKAEEAAKLKDNYNKLEKESQQQLAELKEGYDRKITELERTVVLEKQVAALETKTEYLEKEKEQIKENHDLQLKIKELENELALKREKIAVLQKEKEKKEHEEAKAQFKIERQESAIKFQEMQRDLDNYKMTVQRMSSNSSTSSCNSVSTSGISRSNTADKDELDAIVELRIESDSSDDSFHSCNSDV